LHFQQDGAPSHEYIDVRNFLHVRFPGRWIGRRGRTPDLTPFFLWGAVKNAVCTSKPRTLQDMRREIKIACAAVPLATIQNVCQSAARRCQQCIAAGGGHFEHL